MFSRRSSAGNYQGRLEKLANAAQLFVFNGDIFDFRWSHVGDVEATAQAARQWIGHLASSYAHCDLVFIAGNHDSVPAYFGVLDELSQRFDNVYWTPYYMQLGSKVFLHGDVAVRTMGPRRLEQFRRRCETTRPRGPALNLAYAAATGLRVHRLVPHLLPRRYALRRVLRYLHAALPQGVDAVEDIYFGHTHLPMRSYLYRGKRFHNSGSGVVGQRLQVIPFEYPAKTQLALK